MGQDKTPIRVTEMSDAEFVAWYSAERHKILRLVRNGLIAIGVLAFLMAAGIAYLVVVT